MSKVLLFEPTIDRCGVEALAARAEILMAPEGSEETIARYLSSSDVAGVIVRGEKITRRTIEKSGGLRVIGTPGVGVDGIDVRATSERGIFVVNAPLGNYVSVAEHVIMLLLAVSKRLCEADAAVRKDEYKFRERLYPLEVNGKVFFALGLGRVGSEVAKKCRLGFNMKALSYDPFVSEKEMSAIGVEKVELEYGLRNSDFICVHLPLTKSTQHLIGEKEISYMKPSAILVNVSRGGVIDQKALANALREGRIRGAGLDVLDSEPPLHGDPVLELPNVILSPHVAGNTCEAWERCSLTIANEVLAVIEGRLPTFLVNPEMLAPSQMVRKSN